MAAIIKITTHSTSKKHWKTNDIITSCHKRPCESSCALHTDHKPRKKNYLLSSSKRTFGTYANTFQLLSSSHSNAAKKINPNFWWASTIVYHAYTESNQTFYMIKSNRSYQSSLSLQHWSVRNCPCRWFADLYNWTIFCVTIWKLFPFYEKKGGEKATFNGFVELTSQRFNAFFRNTIWFFDLHFTSIFEMMNRNWHLYVICRVGDIYFGAFLC